MKLKIIELLNITNQSYIVDIMEAKLHCRGDELEMVSGHNRRIERVFYTESEAAEYYIDHLQDYETENLDVLEWLENDLQKLRKF